MYKQYLKQAWQLMKQNRFFSFVYILGTGLAISMVMVMAIVYCIRTADIAPEDCRSRLLQLNRASVKSKDEEKGGTYNWMLSYHAARQILDGLSEVEEACLRIDPGSTGQLMGTVYSQLPGSTDRYKTRLMATDAAFWRIFSFRLLHGKPYTDEEYESGMKRIVLSESYARKLFGSADVIGKGVMINQVEYRVAGVVEDVSSVMTMTCADAWVPVSSVPALVEAGGAERSAGPVCAYMLAKSTAGFEAIRDEVNRRRLQYNTTLQERYVDAFSLSTPQQTQIGSLNYRMSYADIIRRYLLIALVFLLVPAINLTGLISSRMQERTEEMGLRKAFGARSHSLVTQVLTENLLLTCIGGVVGLLVSWLLVVVLRNYLLSSFGFMNEGNVQLTFDMLFNLPLFLSAFGLCVVLNLLSSLLPVWKATRRPIVDSINDK